MSTTTVAPSAAELRARLDARRARLAELQADLDAIPAALAETREALGCALAEGESEGAVKKIRTRLAALEAERAGLDAAVELVRADVDALDAELRPLHAAALEAEADRLEDEAREAEREVARVLKVLAAEFTPLWDRYTAAVNARQQSRAAALEAAGEPWDVVRRATPRERLPAVAGGDWQAFHLWRQFAAGVAEHGRTAHETP
jgi:chromosome segregation ATPase